MTMKQIIERLRAKRFILIIDGDVQDPHVVSIRIKDLDTNQYIETIYDLRQTIPVENVIQALLSRMKK